jgi:hypothetical protein
VGGVGWSNLVDTFRTPLGIPLSFTPSQRTSLRFSHHTSDLRHFIPQLIHSYTLSIFMLSNVLILSFRILWITCLHLLSFPFACSVLFYYAPSQPPKQLLNPGRNIRQNRNSRAVYPAVYGFPGGLMLLGCVSGCVSLEVAYKGFIFEINLL